MKPIDWSAWLRAADLPEHAEPSSPRLVPLLDAYRRRVPFENLDALCGRTPGIAITDIADKIFARGRGGWCYEVNLLLADLLHHAGYAPRMRLGRVSYRRPGPGPLTHLALIVPADGREWLVDPGFGGPGPLAPLPLETGEQEDATGVRWRLDEVADHGLQLSRWMQGQWERLYALAPLAVLPVDIEEANFFLSQWPKSPFKRQLHCVAFDGAGHWCLEGQALVQRDLHWNETLRTPLRDADHLAAVLQEHLDIHAPADVCRAAWARCVEMAAGA